VSLFLLVFFTLYGAMHALVFWGMHPLLRGHPALPTLTAGWMALMAVAPVAVRLLDRGGLEAPARALAWVGYSWMGFLFLAACLFACVALLHLAALFLARVSPALPLLTPHRPAGAAAVLLVVLVAGLYGFHEASRLRVERVSLVTDRLPPERPRLRIVQISDLHLGLINREETLAPLVAAIEALEPDLLVATGDIVDAQIDHLDELVGLWQRLDPPLGKFAVTGNHEFYAGLRQGLSFLERGGFTVLRGETAQAGPVQIVGIDDPAGRGNPDERPLLRGADRSRFTLLLKHRPLIADGAEGLFDLQLSGHTHRGQIVPFNYLTALRFPLQDGLYTLAGGSRLYTSRGTGTWGPPMRVGSPPEVTLIELVRAP